MQAKRGSTARGPPVEKAGWLEKEGAMVKNWKKRWFVLQGNSLHYYKDKDVRTNLASYERMIHLHSLTHRPSRRALPSSPS